MAVGDGVHISPVSHPPRETSPCSAPSSFRGERRGIIIGTCPHMDPDAMPDGHGIDSGRRALWSASMRMRVLGKARMRNMAPRRTGTSLYVALLAAGVLAA